MPFTSQFQAVQSAVILAVAALTLATSTQAHADDDKLIRMLESGGAITPEQAQELRDDLFPPVRSDSSAIKEVEIRGRVQTQFGYVDAENDESHESFHTLEVRRVRMGLRGTLFNDFRAQLEADMKPGEKVSMTAAFLQWREYQPAYIKMGYDKPHSSIEENTSSTQILTVERSLINEHVAAPGRLNGLSLDGEVGMFYYGFGVYTDTENRNEEGEEPQYMKNLLVGLELDELFQTDRLLVQATHMTSDDPDGEIGEELGDRTVAGLTYSMGRIGFQTEYFLAQGEEDNKKISGWYVMPSVFVTESNQLVLRYEDAQSKEDKGIEAPSRYTADVPQIQGDDGPGKGYAYQSLYLGWNHYLSGDDHKLMAGAELATLANTDAGDLDTTSFYAAWRMQF